MHASGAVVRVPPHVPHLYEFLDDTVMTEAWRTPDAQPCAFRAHLYAPFRSRIEPAQLAAATQLQKGAAAQAGA